MARYASHAGNRALASRCACPHLRAFPPRSRRESHRSCPRRRSGGSVRLSRSASLAAALRGGGAGIEPIGRHVVHPVHREAVTRALAQQSRNVHRNRAPRPRRIDRGESLKDETAAHSSDSPCRCLLCTKSAVGPGISIDPKPGSSATSCFAIISIICRPRATSAGLFQRRPASSSVVGDPASESEAEFVSSSLPLSVCSPCPTAIPADARPCRPDARLVCVHPSTWSKRARSFSTSAKNSAYDCAL